jgi:hypothetical protein
MSVHFGGETFEPARDGSRLANQLADVRAYMSDGAWHTLAEIEEATGHPQASISSRLRDLRKRPNGGHTIDREYVCRGLHRYRLLLPKGQLSLGLM